VWVRVPSPAHNANLNKLITSKLRFFIFVRWTGYWTDKNKKSFFAIIFHLIECLQNGKASEGFGVLITTVVTSALAGVFKGLIGKKRKRAEVEEE
jgi:hypothetical protein